MNARDSGPVHTNETCWHAPFSLQALKTLILANREDIRTRIKIEGMTACGTIMLLMFIVVLWLGPKRHPASLAYDVSRSCGSHFAWILSFNLYHSLWGRYYSSEFNSWGNKSSERLSNLTKIAQFVRRRYFKEGVRHICAARAREGELVISLKRQSVLVGFVLWSLVKLQIVLG